MLRPIAVVARKELRETLRDPHVALLLCFPLLFYPLLIWAASQLAVLAEGWQERRPYVVDVEGPAELREALLEEPAVEGHGGAAALARGEVDVVVRAQADGDRWTVEIERASARDESAHAARRVRRRLEALRDERFEARAADAGLTEADLEPLPIRTRDVATDRARLTGIVALLCALIGPTSLALAGVYPAVELFVSERERGTIETTLVVPVRRSVVLAGKLAACVAIMMVGFVGNLVAMVITVAQLQVGLLAREATPMTFDPLALLLALPPVLATAALFAALYLVSMLPARTFKEGELTGSIALMLALAPVLAATVPLTTDADPGALRWVPLANVALVVHDAMLGDIDVVLLASTTVVNGALAALLLAVGVAVGRREDFLVEGRLPRWLSWMHSGGRP